MAIPSHITILGGGPAGLSVAYFARKIGLPFTLYEGSNRIGGACHTFRSGDFLFDCGSHRFHMKYPEITEEVRNLLGDDLQENNIPSQIYDGGKLFDFPLSPLNLLSKLGILAFTRSGIEVLSSRFRRQHTNGSFESSVTAKYGKSLARRFLLNYSEKLWGEPCENLSPVIAGTRLRGLNISTLLIEVFKGREAKIAWLDGTFSYPRFGIGMIAEKLADASERKNIQLQSRITKILHTKNAIEKVEINGDRCATVDHVVTTLPLNLFVQMMDPGPPENITKFAKSLRFRNLILFAVFLDKEKITGAGSTYFPDPKLPFTRVYEPKIRSASMSPLDKTSLICEIPCQKEDTIWKSTDDEISSSVIPKLSSVLPISSKDITGIQIHRISNAYPILRKEFEETVNEIFQFLSQFKNLKFAGRGGKFTYTSIHNMMRFGKEIIDEYLKNG